MGKVIFHFSMSHDGFVTASGIRPDEPMAAGGQRLHAWAMERLDPRDQAELEVSGIGALIAGRRRTYDTSLPWWQANGPTGEARVPLFVVTDPAPESSPPDARSSRRREQ